MVYEYSWNGMERAVPAEKVADHLRKLEKKHGEVTKELFLESARSERSAMHKLFEWDDTKAAEKYRLHQATVIIASIRVTVIEEENEPIVTRAFVQCGQTPGGYLNIEKALSEEDTKRQVLEEAKKEARWFVSKYESLQELASVIDAMNKFLKSA